VAEIRNLEVDFDRPHGGQPVARVCVAIACSYTRDVGAPTISNDCTSYAAFEREVARLKDELDAALEEVAAHFEARAPAKPARAAAPEAAPATRPALGRELRVRDAMTREVKTLRPTDKLALAEELMKVGRFRHVVVLGDADEVAGVVSHRDIVFSALSWTLGQGGYAREKALRTLPVKDVMQREVVTVDPEAPLSQAARTLQERKIGCLPVVEGERLVGILTEGDFLALLAAGGSA
jgi:CBS domain-containing protein